MAQSIDPDRLKQIREARGMTQEQLATKARVTAHSIYRFERGDRPKKKNAEQIARALDVNLEVLSGDQPMPDFQRAKAESPTSNSQLNVRVGVCKRNAFHLVSRRYDIPISAIVELSPLLFAIVAEGSLNRRREKLKNIGSLISPIEQLLQSDFPHLPSEAAGRISMAQLALEDEEHSIEARDLFGFEIPENGDNNAYNWSEGNPFVAYLRELAQSLRDIDINWVTHRHSDYTVGKNEALELAGGDPELADEILEGYVEISREFLNEDAVPKRVEWLLKKRTKSLPAILLELEEELNQPATTTRSGDV